MKQIYFMRHGLSLMNQQGYFSGLIDTPLTKEGREQCQQAAKELANVSIDAIVCSPMKRTLDSAHIIARVIGFPIEKIVISELFMERNFGPLEGAQYRKGLDLDGTKGVEHSTSLINRSLAGLELINSLHADNILVVSHGAIGRALVHAINPSVDYAKIKGFNNGEVVKLL